MKLARRSLLGFALLVPMLCIGASTGLYGQSSGFTEPKPAAGDYFGYGAWKATALSDDGKTALIGASYATISGKTYVGKIYFYSYSGGAWKEVQEFDDPDATAGDYFGITVALSGDGMSALVASYAAGASSADSGKVYLYTLSNGKWTQAHIFTDPTDTASDYLGYGGVALSDDGQTAVISSGYQTFNANANSGEIYIYSDASGSWKQVFSAGDPDATASDYFGLPVTISGDGNSVLVGSYAAVSSATGAGKAYLYRFSNGSWAQAHEFDDPSATANDYFGYSSVALSQDGTTAVMGAYGVTVNAIANAGTAYIFKETSGSWGTPVVIADPDGVTDDYFSYPLAVSQDGTKVFIGDEATVGSAAHAGKAYIYALDNGKWSKLLELDDPTATASDYFSYDGALSGDGETLLSTASYQTVKSDADAGETYIYQSPDDLELALSADSASVTTGQKTALDLTVTNKDSVVIANGVTLSVTLPAGLSYASAAAAGGTCSHSGTNVTCTLSSLAPGATWQPAVTVNAKTAGNQKASASVSSNQPDPASANDTASAAVAVGSPSSGGGSLSLLMLGLLGSLQIFKRRRR